MSLAATTTGTGQALASEVLSNGTVLSLLGTGSTTATFAPIGSLFVAKDQSNSSGAAGTADSSILANAFSVTLVTVPSPIVGAGLPGLMAACGGLLVLARRRRRQIA
jgi:hypothetical protein